MFVLWGYWRCCAGLLSWTLHKRCDGLFTLTGNMGDLVIIGERLERATSPALDAILGQPFKVLNDGFIRVIDYIGNDSAIVQAARISYGAGTKSVSDDRGLIRYLMRHRHTSPFEQNSIKLHVRVPMDTWRQWIRHRTAKVNEYSTRYSEAIDSMQTTSADAWRVQGVGNRQGSSGFVGEATSENLSTDEQWLQRKSREIYESRIQAGVAREQARKDLPLSTYTEAYWKIDLHNLLHFLSLRLDSHAQLEIRLYAEAIADVVRQWCPITWEAFSDYRLNGIELSAQEVTCLKSHTFEGLSKREIEELDSKLQLMGLKE